ncbi:L-aspartate oxidase [Photobacterium aphoticum]|uniref:L-aspartate oxidase n=1 Tax=Photobacterium aphoticum TaxID=754436 RepID=A0A090QYE6_9GAMM|nr:L-aspartate oxidase [Photobacterium aphoticum]
MMKENREHQCDVLVIGSGAAGLSLALRLAPRGKVIVLSKGPRSEGATYYAQGGIAAVFDEGDSVDSHVEDTQIAGAHLCDEAVVRFIAENAKDCVQWLIDGGVPFDREECDSDDSPRYHLTREGGHSHRRILHAADATGMAVQNSLQDNVHHHPNIDVLERHNALDLITNQKLGITDQPNRVLGAISGTETEKRSKPSAPSLSSSPPAARQKYINIPLTLMCLPATGLPWPGVQAVAWRTWNLTSSTPPACSTRMPVTSC